MKNIAQNAHGGVRLAPILLLFALLAIGAVGFSLLLDKGSGQQADTLGHKLPKQKLTEIAGEEIEVCILPDLMGDLTPCGCSRDQGGSLVRAIAKIESVTNSNDYAIVLVGNTLVPEVVSYDTVLRPV